MKLGIAQITTTPGDFPAAMDRIVECSRQADEQGVDLLVFPYVCLTGPGILPFHDEEGLLLDLASALIRLSQELPCPALVPVTSTVDGAIVDEVMLLQEGEIRPIKMLAGLSSAMAPHGSHPRPRSLGRGGLTDDEGIAPDEYPAPDLPILEMGDVTLGIAVSLDDVDDFVDFDFGVDVVIMLSRTAFVAANPTPLIGESLFESRFVDDACEMGAWVAGVGSVGGFNMQAYSGGSFVLTPKGELAAIAPMFSEALLVAEVGGDPEAWLEHPLEPEYCDPNVAIWEALSVALSGCVASMGIRDVVVGLDGSLRSLLVAVLATDALGPTHVHAVVRTDVSCERVEDSRVVVRNLRIGSREVGASVLAPPALKGLAASGEIFSAIVASVAREVSGVALGAWDKTALALGEAAGANMSDLLPFGDVYRSDVLALARMRMTVSPAIPRAALSRFETPSVVAAFVAEDAPEEAVLFVDRVLDAHVEGGSCLTDLVERFGGEEDVRAIVDAYAAAAPSRHLARLALVMSEKTLAEDAAPVGFAWRDHVRRHEDLLSDDAPLGIYGGFLESIWNQGPMSERIERDIAQIADVVREMALGDGMGMFGDVLGDVRAAGGLGVPGHAADSLFGQSWDSPFSEN